MKLILVSPAKINEFEIEWLEAQTENSNFVIQKGHAPFLAILGHNKEISLGLQDGSNTVMNIPGGIMEVDRDKITILLA